MTLIEKTMGKLDQSKTELRELSGDVELTEQALERVSGGTRTKSSEARANMNAAYAGPTHYSRS
jgi:hypothetical protein